MWKLRFGVFPIRYRYLKTIMMLHFFKGQKIDVCETLISTIAAAKAFLSFYLLTLSDSEVICSCRGFDAAIPAYFF